MKIAKDPLVSFCVATFKRTNLLKKTLHSILSQTYKNIEIVVCDNDPYGSSQNVIKKINSQKIRYFKNKKNIGMVKNFNIAFSYSKGDFIVFCADDDPVEKNMIKILMKLYKKYPNCGSYFGASNILIKEKKIAKKLKINLGKNSRADKFRKKGKVDLFDSDKFEDNFFSYNILPYMLWSAGMTKRNIVKKIKGMPDYGSPFLTDYAYIVSIGKVAKMCVINKELASQTVHSGNFGRSDEDLNNIFNGIKSFHRFILKKIPDKKDLLENFLSDWVASHLLSVINLSDKNIKNEITNTFMFLKKKFPFLKKQQNKFLIYRDFPLIGFLIFNSIAYINIFFNKMIRKSH